MASFLDNSGDIILDAVLTDTGRKLLAEAQGNFNITTFSFADDEINYTLYDATATGSGQDLNIMKTPIFEAMTNSAASLKYELISLQNSTTLFLPVTKINTNPAQGEFPGFPFATSTTAKTDSTFVLLANETAVSKFTDVSATQTIPQGFIDGVEWFGVLGSKIVLDQGLDTNQIPFNIAINDGDLIEESWIFEADERILVPLTPDATQVKPPSFVDNDSIATYLLDDNEYYEAGAGAGNANANFKSSVIQGPRGPRTLIPIAAGDLVKYSDYLHNQIGVTVSGFFDDGTDALVIDTKFRLKGNNTGMTIDVPVRVVRSV